MATKESIVRRLRFIGVEERLPRVVPGREQYQVACRNSVEGCLVGLAVGDALGMAVEGLSREDITARFGNLDRFVEPVENTPAYHARLQKGQYTDDTQLCMGVLDSILENEVVSAADVSRRFGSLYQSGELRAAGYATQQACKKIIKGERDTGVINAEGCGPATRAIPIAILARFNGGQDPTDFLEECVRITHDSLVAQQGALVVFNTVHTLLGRVNYFSGTTPQEFIEQLYDVCVRAAMGVPSAMADKLKVVQEYLRSPPHEALPYIGNSAHMPETVGAAVYAFLRTPYDFRQTLITAVTSGGDTDSIAALAGAMSGALNGINAIPNQWKVNVEGYHDIMRKATKFYAALKGYSSTTTPSRPVYVQ